MSKKIILRRLKRKSFSIQIIEINDDLYLIIRFMFIPVQINLSDIFDELLDRLQDWIEKRKKIRNDRLINGN